MRSSTRLVSGLMLIALATLPVMATTCEALCEEAIAPAHESTAADSTTHEGMAGCHESSVPASARLTSPTGHDCRTHDAGMRETEAAVTSNRTALGELPVSDAPPLAKVQITSSSLLAREAYRPAAGISRSHAPLVLRV